MDLADVDRGAPVLASAEADIEADPAIVWAVLADIAAWPEWNPAVRSASLPGDLRVGATFRWAAGPGTITSRLVTVDPPRLLAWTGRSMGLRAAHAWRVAPSADGSSVRTEESLSGLPARLFAGRLRRTLQADLEAWVRLLKLESESRAADEDAVGSRVTGSSADEADTEQARAEETRAEGARAKETHAGGSGADEAAQEPSS